MHFLGCAKRHVQEVRDWACETYPDDDNMRAECMKLNPFRAQGTCNYSVVAYWNKNKGFHISFESSNFAHNRYWTPIDIMNIFSYNINLLLLYSTTTTNIPTRYCTISGGKVTSSMLLKDANFTSTVSNHGGKGLVSVLRKEAGKLGLGGNAASRDVFWRVNAKGSSLFPLLNILCNL